jgi:hypothetical protein
MHHPADCRARFGRSEFETDELCQNIQGLQVNKQKEAFRAQYRDSTLSLASHSKVHQEVAQ